MIRKIKRILILTAFLIMGVGVYAQDGTHGAYSPYSIYGIGDISKEGTAFNKSMGGVGIATRNRRFINYVNPAAVTARDTLSFMADFGLEQSNKIYRQGDLRSAHNTFNIYNFVMSFPIYKSSAFMVGLTPFSDIGYDFSSVETDPQIIGQTGNISYDSYGTGSIYQLFAGAGVTFWKRLSLGAEAIYYFGNLDKVTQMNYSSSSYRSLNSGSDLMVRGTTAKFGLQYEQKLGGDVSMTVGATYRLSTSMKGNSLNYRYATQDGIVDTLRHNDADLRKAGLKIADELGIGISVKSGEKWIAEVNYLRSDWTGSGFDSAEGFSVKSETAAFTSTVSQSFRAGFEIVPNRNDIRYYLRKCAYRAGVYYDQSYYKLNGNNVNSMGLTLGVTLPVFRLYNGLTLGVDLGQRASTRNNMIREQYATFMIGFNVHDIWFQKPQYK